MNDIKCTCRLLKANQAASEYKRELINFVNPKDYPERIPIQKLRISKDFPKKPHHLGTSGVKVMKSAKTVKLHQHDQQVVRKWYKTAKSFPAHNTSTKQIKQTNSSFFAHHTTIFLLYF